jgi:UPF0755 protein
MRSLLSSLRTSSRWVTLIVGVIFVVGSIIWWQYAGRGLPGEIKTVEVQAGASRVTIAKRLKSEGIIRSSARFIIESLIRRRTLLAGTFTLNPTDGLSNIIATLSNKQRVEQRITIPEGWRREQIADYLATKGVDRDQFLALTEGKEGTLFPDTYNIKAEPSAEEVVMKLTNTYQMRTDGKTITSEQLILASIVERESKTDTERPIIAKIYLNRRMRGMKLEADPTVQYGRDTNLAAAGNSPKEWWGPITKSDYTNVISPYNTYIISGLPPTPIANPGLKSIHAVLSPADTDALFFFHLQDGTIITSKTLEEHTRNIRKYLQN